MNSNDLDRELFEVIGRLAKNARQDLLAVARRMAAAVCLKGGPFDGMPIIGKPELVEEPEYDEELIHVYRRSDDGDLSYDGHRPFCRDCKCQCRLGEACRHNCGDVFNRYSPADRDPERSGTDPESRLDDARMFAEHDAWLRKLKDASPACILKKLAGGDA